MAAVIEIKGGKAGNPAFCLAEDLDFVLERGEQIAVVGDNAAGKTRLAELIAGIRPMKGLAASYDFSPSRARLVSENIRFITFRDSYGDADQGYYMQKRWNRQDIDEEDIPTAGVLLDRAFESAELSSSISSDPEARLLIHQRRKVLLARLDALFGLEGMRDKFIISLSSGELRKFQLTKILLQMPRVLIIDNPFIGLDPETRDSISELLGELTRNADLSIILLLSRPETIPPFITHVIRMEGLKVFPKESAAAFRPVMPEPVLGKEELDLLESIPLRDISLTPFYPSGESPEIIRCDGVTVRYGQHVLLKDLDWTVREGERWALTGANGSGKSTLLSLVCADNPQAYACPISLFGHKRGSGESIWEIKRHIGYVSPEMHRAYLKGVPAEDIVASGLFDTIGLFFNPTDDQMATARRWMRIFGIGHLADRNYLELSSGEQRLCLLARAFVKDPELLILDEPLHGLDWRCSLLALQILEVFMRRPHKTLVMVTHYREELPSCIDRELHLGE